MARPRYKINAIDWLDCLDWLDYQSQRSDWILIEEHPIHEIGVYSLQEKIARWRKIEFPSVSDFRKVQQVIDHSLTDEDRSRMRKSLSAKKRRRKDKRLQIKPVNITLTPEAHRVLVEFKELSNINTLSEAVEVGLISALKNLKARQEMNRTKELSVKFASISPEDLVAYIQRYLAQTEVNKSLANTCKVAYQMFIQTPGNSTTELLVDRLVEDLIWNETHLKITADSLDIF